MWCFRKDEWTFNHKFTSKLTFNPKNNDVIIENLGSLQERTLDIGINKDKLNNLSKEGRDAL